MSLVEVNMDNNIIEHWDKDELVAMANSVISDADEIQGFLALPPNPLKGPINKLAGNILVLGMLVKEILRRSNIK